MSNFMKTAIAIILLAVVLVIGYRVMNPEDTTMEDAMDQAGEAASDAMDATEEAADAAMASMGGSAAATDTPHPNTRTQAPSRPVVLRIQAPLHPIVARIPGPVDSDAMPCRKVQPGRRWLQKVSSARPVSKTSSARPEKKPVAGSADTVRTPSRIALPRQTKNSGGVASGCGAMSAWDLAPSSKLKASVMNPVSSWTMVLVSVRKIRTGSSGRSQSESESEGSHRIVGGPSGTSMSRSTTTERFPTGLSMSGPTSAAICARARSLDSEKSPRETQSAGQHP